jgi:hypothetical protein
MSWDGPSDWETMQALEPRAGEQLERTLERYARVRLDPSPAQARRARAAVMEAAWRAHLGPESASRRWHLPFARWHARRVGLAATAAVLAGLCIGTSAFAASRAGGPLYDTRIAIEDALLPADPAARVQAQIANAQMRLAEAYDAESRGDGGALDAALRAYGDDAASLAAVSGPGADLALAAVEQHRAVLVSLIGRAPAEALPGLNQAVSRSDKAIEQLTNSQHGQHGQDGSGANPGSSGRPGSNGNGPGSNSGSDPGSNSGNGPGSNSGNGSGSGNGAASAPPTSAPVVTPKPQHTPEPKPLATPSPDPTPKPEHTPKPHPTPKPKPGTESPTPSS